jgi:hypothetical protein
MGLAFDQHHLVVAMNSGQELFEFLYGRRVRACDRNGDVSNLVHNTPADGFVDCIPGGKEPINIRRAHAEFGGDRPPKSYGSPRGETVSPPLPSRILARASSKSFPVRTGRFIELSELYSAANAGRNSGCSAEL